MCVLAPRRAGRANLRNFVLFLMWALASTAYSLLMAAGLLWGERMPLLLAFAQAWDRARQRWVAGQGPAWASTAGR